MSEGYGSGRCKRPDTVISVLCVFLLGMASWIGMVAAQAAEGNVRNAAADTLAGAAAHNIIRDALSAQTTLNNLGYGLNESYDFSRQPAPAQALPALQDSQVLQDSAARHAQACSFQHINNQYGQNLFAGTGTGWTLEHAVNSWANEVRHYDYQTGSCAAGEQCGHYTQIVWANSRHVGCVLQQCATMTDQSGNSLFDGRSGVMIFCHYDPPGNVVAQKPYPEAVETPLADLAVKVKVLLQGAYQPAEKRMRAALVAALPLSEPYTQLGHTVSGDRQLNASLLPMNGADAVVDWVLLELRKADQPEQLLAGRAVLIQSDGDLIDPQTGSELLVFPGWAAADYHLAVRHRNHLGVMTRQPVALSDHTVTVDFSAPVTPVWGENARFETAGRSLLWGGDVNHDGRVIAAGVSNDLGNIFQTVLMAAGNDHFSANYIAQGYQGSDVNLDGRIIAAGDGNDYNLVSANVFLHPGNATINHNFIIQQQLP